MRAGIQDFLFHNALCLAANLILLTFFKRYRFFTIRTLCHRNFPYFFQFQPRILFQSLTIPLEPANNHTPRAIWTSGLIKVSILENPPDQ